MSNFNEHLQNKLGKHKQEEIEELILDKLIETETLSEDHKSTLELYKSLIHLTLNKVGLKSLKNFPKLKNLQILELNENKLEGENLDILIEQCPKLYKLKLEKNQISDIENIYKLLNELKIKKLYLKDNKLPENYEKLLFDKYSFIESIDNKNKDGEEVESTIYDDEDEEGNEDDLDEEEFDEVEDDEGEEFEDGEEKENDGDGDDNYEDDEDEEDEKDE